jgi:hypothetical protein
MKKCTLSLCYFICISIWFSHVYAQTPSQDPHWVYHSFYSDEFNYTGSHAQIISQLGNKWHFLAFDYNPPSSLGYVFANGKDIDVNNGVLILSAKHDPGHYPYPLPNDQSTKYYNYTRCQLVSDNLMHYGYYEIKFRLPYYPNLPEKIHGIGANFWLFPVTRSSTPYYEEIDVFEQITYQQYMFGPTIHYFLDNGQNPHTVQNSLYPNIGWSKISDYQAPFNYPVDFSDGEFHVVGLEWQKEYFAIYLDNVLVKSINFKQDVLLSQNVLLDLNVEAADVPKGQPGVQTSTIFPYNYELEYFRYYNINTSSIQNLSICSPNYANSNSSNNLGYTLRNDVVLGGTGCTSAKINTGADFILRAKSSITLEEGFECDQNTTLYFQVNDL